MSVIKLREVKATEDKQLSGDDVIERLEEALAMAKDGLISNLVLVAAMNDGDVMDCWANGSNPYLIVGGLEGVKRDFMDCVIEGR